ncbi:MAG: dienelactone hydrolase family protein [Pseudorhodobacter sp.]
MGLSRNRLKALTGCSDESAGIFEAGRDWRIGRITCMEGVIRDGNIAIPSRLLMPDVPRGAAVLYAHAHGNAYGIGKAEATEGRPALLDPPLGLWLAAQGHVVLCPDMPGFGERQEEGTEAALSKAALWQGRPLLGVMLDDLARAGAALKVRPEVDPARIAVIGLSMGATLAYFHAALRPEIAACAHFCAFADIAPLIATGAHDLHGSYMTVPGLLPAHDLGDVAALIAPRLQIVGVGLRDPLTPPAAFTPALDRLRRAYAKSSDRLQVVVEPEGGHRESPAMRTALHDLFT